MNRRLWPDLVTNAAPLGAVLTLGEEVPHPADWVSLLEQWTAARGGLFPCAHFHTAEGLEKELREVGLTDISVCAIEGPDGLALEQLGR